MKDLNEQILNNVDASVNQQSFGIDLNYRYGVSIQAIITGSPIGILRLQGSNDYGSRNSSIPDQGQGVVNWSDIANSDTPVAGAGSASWNFQGSFYKWIRLIYVATSGTGNITARANSKGF